MSRAQVHSTGSGATQGVDLLLASVSRVVTDAIDQYFGLLRRSARLADRLMPRNLRVGLDCCEVPTQDCPPRCVCEIDWRATPGESVSATIRVTNTSAQTRNFTFSASPWSGGADAPGALNVSPTSAVLASGQSVVLRINATVGQQIKSGLAYTGEIEIRGSYEQHVCVTLHVLDSPVVHCEVEQGDPPVRITELKWYRHYQCVDPCVPPRDPQLPTG